MKIPKTFVKENLEAKTEQLLNKKKIFFDYDEIYQKLFTHFETYLTARASGWKGVLYISDEFDESRYYHVKEVIKNVMTGLPISNKWELLNYYGMPEDDDLFTELYHEMLFKRFDTSLIPIIYTSNCMTGRIVKDVRKKSMLVSGAIIIYI